MEILDFGGHFHIVLEYRSRAFKYQLPEVKKISGAEYDRVLKVWAVPGTARTEVEEFAVKWKAVLDDPFDRPNFDEMPEMPELDFEIPLRGTPRPYQSSGIARGLLLKRLIIADEQGLGKTLEAIGILLAAEARGEQAFPALVVCTASAKENWRREIEKWSNKRAMVLTDRTKTSWPRYWQSDSPEVHADVFITNYQNLKKYFVLKMPAAEEITHSRQIILRPETDFLGSIIIDESHRIKNPLAQQTKITLRLALNRNYRIALSGTPVVNRPIDLFAQLAAIGQAQNFGGTLAAFRNRYCSGDMQASNLKELNFLLNKFCYFRREKKDVAKDLPEKVRQTFICDITTRPEYNHAVKEFREWLERAGANVEKAMKAAALVKMNVLRQISARGKVREVLEWTEELLEAGEKVLLFCNLSDIVDRLKAGLPKGKYITITGSDSTAARQRSIDAFQSDPKVQVAIINIIAGGESLTLTAANYVGFVEFPWTAAGCFQCEDRTHRIGQTKTVFANYFLGHRTIDERLFEIIMEKKDIGNAITGATDEMEMKVVDRMLSLFNQKTYNDGHQPDNEEDADGPTGARSIRNNKAPGGDRPDDDPRPRPAATLF